MKIDVQDSPHRCPRDGKRMVQSAGQHVSGGDLEVKHECWHCGFAFTQRPERDKPGGQARRSLAEILADVRAGNLAKRPIRPPAAFEAIVEEASNG